ncbi:MAG: nitroreductase [Pseudomonadales bacterium]
MDALELLHTRVSSSRLSGNVSPEKLEAIVQAALRAPDHAQLRPWRFLAINGRSLERLGALFAQAKLTEDPSISSTDLEKLKKKPLRAPVIIVAIMSFSAHPKVPEVEQILSMGAAVQSMLLAAFAQGLGSMWRTGGMAYSKIVQQGLGLNNEEAIAGFLYLGEVEGKLRTVRPLESANFMKEWTDR